jgi:hypothetical protein
MKRHPKDRGFGYKKPYNYEQSIKELKNKKMNFKEWKEATLQGYEDPCEHQQKIRYCEVCDIEESKTYFIEETNICQDCYEEKQKYTIKQTKNKFNINTKL